MKRSMTERDQMENLTMANCLMFLSRGDHHHQLEYSPSSSTATSSSPSRVFECKTCNRQFPSFQALGGHRASHKKPRVMTGDGGSSDSQSSPAKPKTHECTICGLEFAIGQALGGHMRRHRTTMSSSATHDHHNQPQYHHQYPLIMNNNPSASQFPGLKKSARILSLDLNLTPLENDIKILQLGKTVQLVDCFL